MLRILPACTNAASVKKHIGLSQSMCRQSDNSLHCLIRGISITLRFEKGHPLHARLIVETDIFSPGHLTVYKLFNPIEVTLLFFLNVSSIRAYISSVTVGTVLPSSSFLSASFLKPGD